MKHIEIINGPNLNLTGIREPEVYGTITMEDYIASMRLRFPNEEIGYWQSNVEGEIINRIHQVGFACDGLIVNFGGYGHTSVALHDALRAVTAPAIEVHLSNIFAREEYRRTSLIASACIGVIAGLGLTSYALALEALLDK